MTYDKVFNNDYPPMVNTPEKLKQQEEEEQQLIVRVDKGHEPLVSICRPLQVQTLLEKLFIAGCYCYI